MDFICQRINIQDMDSMVSIIIVLPHFIHSGQFVDSIVVTILKGYQLNALDNNIESGQHHAGLISFME
jgi:hypothetical protein